MYRLFVELLLYLGEPKVQMSEIIMSALTADVVIINWKCIYRCLNIKIDNKAKPFY